MTGVAEPEIFRLAGVSVRFRRHAIESRSLKHRVSHWMRRERPDEHVALREISLVIRRGERVGLIGRNGAGKSTLLRVLARVITPQSGRVDVARVRIAPLLELGLGFQPDLSGRENCRLAGALLGYGPREMDRRMDGILAFADIGAFADEPVRAYSSGMYARLAFALATDVQPDVLVVDEVFGVGDEFFVQKCVARMRELLAAGLTTVFVSHDATLLGEHCERLIWLDEGRLVLDGPAAEVSSRYRHARGVAPA